MLLYTIMRAMKYRGTLALAEELNSEETPWQYVRIRGHLPTILAQSQCWLHIYRERAEVGLNFFSYIEPRRVF